MFYALASPRFFLPHTVALMRLYVLRFLGLVLWAALGVVRFRPGFFGRGPPLR